MTEEAEIKIMLQKHIDDSNDFRSTIVQQLKSIEVHNEYTKKELSCNTADIKELQNTHNKQKGAIWAFGILSATAAGKTLIDMFK